MTDIHHHKVIDPVDYFYCHLLKQKRDDGRKLSEFRAASVQTDLISSAHGSALVRIGDTVVVASVKGEIVDERSLHKSGDCLQGRVLVSVEGQPYFEESINKDMAKTRSIIQSLVDSGRIVDLSKLLIDPSNVYWLLYVDVTVLNSDGISLDVCLLAISAALISGRLPKMCVSKEPDEENIKNEESTSLDVKDIIKRDVIVFTDETINIPCVDSSAPIGAAFLILTSKDFESCATDHANLMDNQANQEFILCDPTEQESLLFPNNILTIVLGNKPNAAPTILSIFKCAGSSNLNEGTIDTCCKLAVKRKLELDSLWSGFG